MNDRDKIIRRIKQLRERTTKRGSTEAEAMAAAEKAAALMGKHGLTDTDIEVSEAASETAVAMHSQRATLTAVIAYVTNTAVVYVRRDGVDVANFVGFGAGPELGAYLRDVCERAVDRELRQFKGTTFYRRRRSLSTKRQAAADFTGALINRLAVRLVEIFHESSSDDARQRAVAVRNERYGGVAVETKMPGKVRYSEAGNAGWRAGGNVGLHRGVGAAGNSKLIGGH